MLRLIGFRILQTIPTLIGVTVVVFVLVRLTGDPAAIMLPPQAPPSAVAAFRAEYGLDHPLIVQYVDFLRGIVTGNLGTSIRYEVPVTELIGSRFLATFSLALASIALSVVIGVGLGVLAGTFQHTKIDTFARLVALGGQAIPTFYLGIILILIFGVWFHVLPTVGMGGPSSFILPCITLGFFLVPLVLRVTRNSVLDELNQGYVRTARSSGMSERRIILVHVLKNAMVPVITVVGLQVGIALGGAIITETVFAWPGLGQLLVTSISTRDYPVVQGLVLLAAVIFITVNLMVDLAYRLIDPRIRLN